MCFYIDMFETIAAFGLESVPMTPSLYRQIDTSHRQLDRSALSII